MQVKILFPPGALVHGPYARARGGKDFLVVRLRCGGAVAEIAQQKVAHVFIAVQATGRLQTIAQGQGAFYRADEHRHGHQHARFVAQRLRLEFQETAGTDKARGNAAQQHHRRAPSQRHAQRQNQQIARNQRVKGKQRRRQQRLGKNQPAAPGIRRKAGQAHMRAQPAGQSRAALVVIEPPTYRAARFARMLLWPRTQPALPQPVLPNAGGG